MIYADVVKSTGTRFSTAEMWRRDVMNNLNSSGRDEDDGLWFGPHLSEHSPLKVRQQSGWRQRVLLYVVVIIAALGGLLFGYDTAVISGAMLFLRVNFALNAWMQEVTVSVALLGAAIGSLGGGKLSDMLGRRTTLRLTA